MMSVAEPPASGLDRIEKALFLGGVVAFAFLMLAFGAVGDVSPVPIAAVFIALGVGFVWWFDRHLARRRR
jgi:Flp pilus assembly protein TadB